MLTSFTDMARSRRCFIEEEVVTQGILFSSAAAAENYS
jgi:hypothetical protein